MSPWCNAATPMPSGSSGCSPAGNGAICRQAGRNEWQRQQPTQQSLSRPLCSASSRSPASSASSSSSSSPPTPSPLHSSRPSPPCPLYSPTTPSTTSKLLLAAAFLAYLTSPASAQLRIIAPQSLANDFSQTHGVVYGTTATFGTPFYGEHVLGNLLYGESKGKQHCTDEDYDIPADQAETGGEMVQHTVNIILVRRGECTFAQKVRVAAAKGAHAVVVVDKEKSDLTSEEIQKIVMASDGLGDDIRIPSILVSKDDGKKLIEAVQAGHVMAELAWDIPRGEVVIADFWMSSGSRESTEFLTRFKESAELLQYHLQFIPHYHLFSLPEGKDTTSLCLQKIDSCPECQVAHEEFCAPEPEQVGPITGADVVNEDLRQVCIWQTTSRKQQENGASYSQAFWDYVVKYGETCAGRSFGYDCSLKVMSGLGISVPEVEGCIKKNYRTILADHLVSVAWSAQALRLNGWRYSGPLDPETVLKALCSGYASPLRECIELLDGYTEVYYTPGITFSTVIVTIVIVGLTLVVAVDLYRRHVTRSVRKVLREEVMLEVQTQMADYIELEDNGGSSRKHGTLTF